MDYKLSPALHKLAEIYKQEAAFSYPTDVPKIQVDTMVAKIAKAYEKVRYAVDYKEEHLLRRNAISRILKRNYLWQQTDLKKVSESLIEELIRAGHVPNNTLPETVIDDVAHVLKRYHTLTHCLEGLVDKKTRGKLAHWLVDLSAVEIESHIASVKRERALLETYYRYVRERIDIKKANVPEHELDVQMFIACHTTLLRSDPAAITYDLLHRYEPRWQHLSESECSTIAPALVEIKKHIDDELAGSLAYQLTQTLKSYAVYFSIIADTLRASEKDGLFFDVPRLEKEITHACEDRYKLARKKLRISALNAIIYIFATKIGLAFVIEVPYDLFILGHINYIPLVANVVVHPAIMFAIAAFTRVPNQKNTQAIIAGIKNILYKLEDTKILHVYKRSAQSGSTSSKSVAVIYSLVYLLSFGIIISILSSLGFNIVSGFLFVFFLTLISFFGIRIRNQARSLVVLKRKENIITLLFDLISVPLIRVGRWISIRSSKINIFIFLFDYIIENPVKLIIKAIESGVLFIKEKRDEVD